MGEGSWTSGAELQGEAPPRRTLPRVEDLPTVGDGYDRAAVEAAFDAFYRHAAEVDATLSVLEAVDAFQKQAADLRADIRALRAASWAPAHARQGLAGTYAPRPAPERGAVLDVMPRIAVEAAFIILVGVGAALAGLGPAGVILLVLAAWLVVALGEAVAAATRPAPPPPRLPPPRPVAAHAVRSEPAPTQVVPADEVEAVAVEPEPVLEPVYEPEPYAEPVEAERAAESDAIEEEPEAERRPFARIATEQEQEAEAEAEAEPETPEAALDNEQEEPRPPERAEPGVEAPGKRSFWRRLTGAREAEVPPPETEAPRHVRVLATPPEAPEGPEAEAADPWEQGPDLPAREPPGRGPAAEEEPPEQRHEEVAEAERPPGEIREEPEPVAAEPLAQAPLPAAPEPEGLDEEPLGELEPAPEEALVELEPPAEEPIAELAQPEEEPDAVEGEPAAVAPEAVAEPADAPARTDEPGEEREEAVAARGGGGWRFWRRRPAAEDEPDEPTRPAKPSEPHEPHEPQHVRVIDVEQSVVPESVEVPWDAEHEDDTLGWGAVQEPDDHEAAGRPEPARAGPRWAGGSRRRRGRR